MPFEPRPQPSYAEPLPVQVEEGLAMATVVEESAAPPPPTAAVVVEEERAATEMTAPQAALEPLAWTGSGGEDMVMVPVDDGSAPPPLARERDVATSVAPESSAAVTTALIEIAADTSTSRYLDFLGIGIIDLDTTKLPSNDREILEAVTEWVFADPSLLDAIALDPPVPRQDGDAGGSAPSAAPEVAEGVLGESAADTELRSSPLQHLSGRARTRPCSSLQRQSWLRPPLRWSARLRESSEEWGHRRPACCR
jgi:hypothetical protein